MPVNPARGKPRQVRWHVAYQSEDMVTDDEIRLSGWGGDERRGATARVGGDGDLRWYEQRRRRRWGGKASVTSCVTVTAFLCASASEWRLADCALAATVKSRAKRTTQCAALNAAVSEHAAMVHSGRPKKLTLNTAFERPVAYDLDIRGAQTAFILFSTFLDLRPVSAARYSQTSIYGWL
jgi:hypothetical protein